MVSLSAKRGGGSGITKDTSFNIVVKSTLPTDKSFSELTDAEVTQLAQALRDGTVSSLNWEVGDTRTTNIGSFTHYIYGEGQKTHAAINNVEMVILHKGSAGKKFTDNTDVHFIIGFKNSLCSGQYNSYDNVYQNSYLWKTEDNIYNALSADLKPAFKQFKAVTGILSSDSQTSYNRYMCSPAEAEVFGSGNYCIQAEFNALTKNAQFDYYKITNNRKKSSYDYLYVPYDSWWMRSPISYIDGYNYACAVNDDGTDNYFYVYFNTGISPFGCM